MKLILMLSLLALALPTAAASHEYVVASVGSDNSGDCPGGATGSSYNDASSSARAAGVTAGAGAATNCTRYTFWGATYEYRGVGASAFVYSPAGFHSASAQWYSGSSGCNMNAYVVAAGQSLGCPAGGPPAVPGLLP